MDVLKATEMTMQYTERYSEDTAVMYYNSIQVGKQYETKDIKTLFFKLHFYILSSMFILNFVSLAIVQFVTLFVSL